MTDLLQQACSIADARGHNFAAVVDATAQGEDIYLNSAATRQPLLDWAKGYEVDSTTIYFADKLSNGWEAY